MLGKPQTQYIQPPALPDPLPAAPQATSAGAPTPAGNKGGGYGSTLMTSGQGVDSSGTNTARKSLLGQ